MDIRKTIKLVILSAVALTVSDSHAQQKRCRQFTNFCDSITLQRSGDLAYGGWDFQCGGDWVSVNIIGNIRSPAELATRPLDDTFPSTYTLQFSFNPPDLFQLNASYGIGHNIVTFEEGSYTITDGACSFSGINRRKPRLMSSIDLTSTAKRQSRASIQCMHFANFCDTIVFSISGAWAYGDWDWQCKGDWTSSFIMGNAKAGQELATRPWLNEYYLVPYSMQFQFKAGNLFDLYQTAGVDQGVSKTRGNELFTITSGACVRTDVDTTKPRLVNR